MTPTPQWSELRKEFHLRRRRHQTGINWILLGVVVVLALLLIRTKYPQASQGLLARVAGLEPDNVQRAASLAALVRDVATTLALGAGGVWTYYRFVRGRTLKIRLRMDLSLRQLIASDEQRRRVAIVRCAIENTGQVRVRPLYAEARSFAGRIGSQAITYRRCDKVPNIFVAAEAIDQRMVLEPQNGVSIDFPIFVDPAPVEEGEEEASERLLMVRVMLVSSTYYAWESNAMIYLDKEDALP